MSHLDLSRRDLLSGTAALGLCGPAFAAPANSGVIAPPTAPRWLDGAPPPHFIGNTFGVPWPRGAIQPRQTFRLTSAEGDHAVQSWPIAFWPDGSVKWTAHAVSPEAGKAKGFNLLPGPAVAPAEPIRVETTADRFVVTTGAHRWTVMRKGGSLFGGAFIGEKQILGSVRLIAQTQDHADLEDGNPVKTTRYTGEIQNATIEQSGPVRAVIRVEGKHKGATRAWLPFTLRLYFYAGSEAVRIVHSFIFDGDVKTDFISGIGLTAEVPMRDAFYDRHIRFGGEDRGLWAEAVQTVTGLRRDPGKPYRDAQIAGQALPPLSGMAAAVREEIHWVPAWNDFTLSHATSDGFTLRKRLVPGHAWITAASGHRATGLVYAGGASGGAALAMGDFWQRSPTRLDVRGGATDKAQLTAWLWSPDAPPMDLRTYRPVDGMDNHEKEIEGLNITYEDYEAGWDTAFGIARTSELTLWTLPTTPSNEILSDMAGAIAKTPRLVVAPERLHQANVFGIWSLPDRSTPAKVEIEDRLIYLVDYYLKQIEQRRWYGFWDYGDVMHTYDADRHVWRYDVGGYAWDNSELSTDMLFWYEYLRSGRADIFRMAEAMTRHTGEVDVYHIGPYKGFGTRHGVQHFSDSSKQPRISNAAYRRFYYYLTADERCGDLMHDLIHSDETLKVVDISRKLGPKAQGKPSSIAGYPSCGFGTSWGSFLAAWLTEWERTGDTAWRDRILNGMHSIAKMKHGWFAGEAPYDLKTGTFLGAGDTIAVAHLSCVFGIFEIQNELFELVDAPDYKKVWLDYCRYYNAPDNEIGAFLGTVPKDRSLRVAHSRLTALAATESHDSALTKRAWREFYQGDEFGRRLHPDLRHIAGPAVLHPIDEDPAISTNDAAQWGLAAIANLALIGSAL